MSPVLARDVIQAPAARRTLEAERQLVVAARTLSAAAVHEMRATTVVGVLGLDDVDALRSVVSDVTEEYGLEATLKLQPGFYSVQFTRRSVTPLGAERRHA